MHSFPKLFKSFTNDLNMREKMVSGCREIILLVVPALNMRSQRGNISVQSKFTKQSKTKQNVITPNCAFLKIKKET